MRISLPTDLALVSLERYDHALDAATWADLLQHREQLVDAALAGQALAGQLLPTVTAAIDRRPEGRAAAARRAAARAEGEQQLRQRPGSHRYRLVERTRNNRAIWDSPLNVDPVAARHVFGEQVRRPNYRNDSLRLVLREDPR